LFPNELCWCEAFERLEPSGVIVGIDEQIEMSAQLVVVIVEVSFDGSLLDRPVHTLDLAAFRGKGPLDLFLIPQAPRVIGFGQAMLDLVGIANHIEAVHAELCNPTVPVPWLIGKLYPVIGQDDVDLVGNGFQNSLKKDYGCGPVRLFIEPDDGKFRCAINGYEHVEIAFTRPDFGDIEIWKKPMG
jgi:hypothetical protein